MTDSEYAPSHYIRCSTCGREILYGLTDPGQDVAYTWPARQMRGECKKRMNPCRFEATSSTEPLPILDQLRLGLITDEQAHHAVRAAT